MPLKLEIILDDDSALALAQLCKRIGFYDCMSNAVDESEAYKMLLAITILQKSLSTAGFSPR